MTIILFAVMTLSAYNTQVESADEYICNSESNLTLCEIYKDDQADLFAGMSQDAYAEVVKGRIERVGELSREGKIETAWDFYHAAVIHHHSSQPGHWIIAHAYATSAHLAMPEHPTFKWLMTAIWDRLSLHLTGAQLFGTQIRATTGELSGKPCVPAPLPEAVYARFAPDAAALADRPSCEADPPSQ